MIKVKTNKTSDTRSCDVSTVSKEQLIDSSRQHIGDVNKGLGLFIDMLRDSGFNHDYDKLTNIDSFYEDFSNDFKTTKWWDAHRKISRHHLIADDGVPDDVNLIDVLEMIADCTMAGMVRTGEVYPLQLSPSILQKAFDNTAELLKNNIEVEE